MSEGKSKHRLAVEEYFVRIDGGDFPSELFAEDFEFHLPKFGVGAGKGEFDEYVKGVRTIKRRTRHHMASLRFVEDENMIVVEGTTEGTINDELRWHGGRTPGGRFCSIFEFDRRGLIKRMYLYLDPDYGGQDEKRFLWNRGDRQLW